MTAPACSLTHRHLIAALQESGWRDDESMALYDGDVCWTPPDRLDDSGTILLILTSLSHTTDDGTPVPAGRITLQVEQPDQPHPNNLVFQHWDDEAVAISRLRGRGLLPRGHVHDYACVGDNDVCVECGHIFDPEEDAAR